MLKETRDEIYHIKRTFEKIQNPLFKGIRDSFIKEKIIPLEFEKNFWFEPDFELWDEWKIETSIAKVYYGGSSRIKKETLTKVDGLLFITKHSVKLEPSFRFIFDAQTNSLSTDNTFIEKIISEGIKREQMSARKILGEELCSRMDLFDEEVESYKKKLKKEVIPIFNQLGFSEEERNTMILGAMASSGFSNDLSPEGFISLALKFRGKQVSGKK